MKKYIFIILIFIFFPINSYANDLNVMGEISTITDEVKLTIYYPKIGYCKYPYIIKVKLLNMNKEYIELLTIQGGISAKMKIMDSKKNKMKFTKYGEEKCMRSYHKLYLPSYNMVLLEPFKEKTIYFNLSEYFNFYSKPEKYKLNIEFIMSRSFFRIDHFMPSKKLGLENIEFELKYPYQYDKEKQYFDIQFKSYKKNQLKIKPSSPKKIDVETIEIAKKFKNRWNKAMIDRNKQIMKLLKKLVLGTSKEDIILLLGEPGCKSKNQLIYDVFYSASFILYFEDNEYVKYEEKFLFLN